MEVNGMHFARSDWRMEDLLFQFLNQRYSPPLPPQKKGGFCPKMTINAHRIHVRYIYLRLVDVYDRCG